MSSNGIEGVVGIIKCPCQVTDIVTKLRDGYQFHYIAKKHGKKYTSITGGKMKNRFTAADLDTI